MRQNAHPNASSTRRKEARRESRSGRRGGIEVAEKLGALALVTKALKETAQPIDDIARSCGFKNGNYLKNLFRSRFGMTMREYRERG